MLELEAAEPVDEGDDSGGEDPEPGNPGGDRQQTSGLIVVPVVVGVTDGGADIEGDLWLGIRCSRWSGTVEAEAGGRVFSVGGRRHRFTHLTIGFDRSRLWGHGGCGWGWWFRVGGVAVAGRGVRVIGGRWKLEGTSLGSSSILQMDVTSLEYQ